MLWMRRHLAWLTGVVALCVCGCLGIFSDRERYCRGAAEGVPTHSARSVYEHCVKEGYDEHVREERRCARAGRACCAAYCRCKKVARECDQPLQLCAKPYNCFFMLAEDCRC
jgi:hypothetical protein